MTDKMNEDSNKRFKYLTSDNWAGWFKGLILECSNLVGMRDLIKNSIEIQFKIVNPEYRIRAIEEGAHRTNINRRREGFITDENGNFLTVSEEVRRSVDRTWLRESEIQYKEKEKYDNAKRTVLKYIMTHLSKEIEDMLEREGEFEAHVGKSDIINMLKIIKKCATGRGSSSVVLDGQRIMNMRLKGESAEQILSTVNEFSENVVQLRDGRTDKEVVDGLLNGMFMMVFAPCKALDRQIEELMDSEVHPSWSDMANKFTKVLRNKKYIKKTILKSEVDYGLVEAHYTEEEKKRKQSEMICFKCGSQGHSSRGCTKPIGTCKVCGKSHHTNAHEIYNVISKKRSQRKSKQKFSYEKDITANEVSIRGDTWDYVGYDDHKLIDDYCKNRIDADESCSDDELRQDQDEEYVYTKRASVIDDDEVLEDIYCGAIEVEEEDRDKDADEYVNKKVDDNNNSLESNDFNFIMNWFKNKINNNNTDHTNSFNKLEINKGYEDKNNIVQNDDILEGYIGERYFSSEDEIDA